MTTKSQLLRRGPQCAKCGLHIGNGAATECGHCRNPQPLSFRELLRMGRLVRDLSLIHIWKVRSALEWRMDKARFVAS